VTFEADRRRRDLEVIDQTGEHADRLVVAELERDLLIWEDDRTRRFRLTVAGRAELRAGDMPRLRCTDHSVAPDRRPRRFFISDPYLPPGCTSVGLPDPSSLAYYPADPSGEPECP